MRDIDCPVETENHDVFANQSISTEMTHDYLTDLNQEQRRAVKHGVKDGSALNSRPLLVIAGAGSGKTKTLAHRVAHLVVNGIDPQRILLLTFSRRAALDMTGRVKRITGAAMGIAEIDLPWLARSTRWALEFCGNLRTG
jgi:superfamily I DNA and RNA helicase